MKVASRKNLLVSAQSVTSRPTRQPDSEIKFGYKPRDIDTGN